MAGITIGIDLCHYPLLVGCQIAGTFLVQEGSKGAKFNSNDVELAAAELVECFADARDVAKSYFGSPNIKNAVLVVPNDYNYKACEQSIKEAANNRAFIHILDIIPEHIAVAAAYADKTKPNDEDLAKITIISSTSGACDVHVVSIRVASGMGYRYQVKRRGSQAHHVDAGAGKISIGKISFARPGLDSRGMVVLEQNDLARIKKEVERVLEGGSLEKVVDSEKVGLEKVVFVGKSAELVNMREIINEGFTLIEEWTDSTAHDSDQLAAYGAAKLASYGNPVQWSEAFGTI